TKAITAGQASEDNIKLLDEAKREFRSTASFLAMEQRMKDWSSASEKALKSSIEKTLTTLRQGGNCVATLISLGTNLATRGELERAEAALKWVVRQPIDDPSHFSILYGHQILAHVLMAQDKYKEAALIIESALPLIDDWPLVGREMWACLSMVYLL